MDLINPGHAWMILLLLIVILIVRGPGKLPEVGAGLGRALREFRHAMSDSGPTTPPTHHTESDTTTEG